MTKDKINIETEKKIVYIPIDRLYPHPDNPRKDLGDLSELADSIKAKGILQNLTVVPGHRMSGEEYSVVCRNYKESPSEDLRCQMNKRRANDGYTVIIGHRRTEAARLAGLDKLPCIITEMTQAEQIQTMLLENMQRSDLTVYEQAQGFQMMLSLGDSVESIADKTGFSQSTVRRRLKMAELDSDILKSVSSERQLALSDFDRLAEIKDIKSRNDVLAAIGTSNFENCLAKALTAQKREERKAVWLEELQKYSASPIIYGKLWDGQYKIPKDSHKNIEADPAEILKDNFAGCEECYYHFDDYGYIYLRVSKTEKDVEKATADELERREKEATAKRRREALKAAFKQAYQLRFAFVNKLSESAAKKHIATIAVRSVDDISRYCSNTSNYDKLLGLESSHDMATLRKETAEKYPYKSLLTLAYIKAGESDSLTCALWDGFFRQSNILSNIYDFLVAIGYQMSDEEKALMDGTHELYAVGEDLDDDADEDIDDEDFEDEGFDEDYELDEIVEDKTTDDEIISALKEKYGDGDE